MDVILRGLFSALSKPQVVLPLAFNAAKLANEIWPAAGGPDPAGTFSLAVLGESEAGKTRLIESWLGVSPEVPAGRTQSLKRHGTIPKRNASGELLLFTEVFDVSGDRDALPDWDMLVDQGRWILYLINAQRLVEQPVDLQRLAEDADLIRGNIRRREQSANVTKVGTVLVVTHTDLDPRSRADGYEALLSEQLDQVLLRFGGDLRVRLVSGSLATQADADRLTERITGQLRSWTW
jgi:hypothetical protein